ncbi:MULTISPECIES: histidinol dehydrogenase [Thermoanaerobacterium]|jgi:histidinol dehydrogenase|uniref:Histidinol dehydrogenase n=1 Tax=Thermoanaerobacterium butyriciformans TaxID=1702242 RepID=A0ABS4NDN4_9THEO|nr:MULTISPECIES: histidinol dehydrogenase [Thermoanaerobacterium]MBE0069699.1 histidinol dehydrogenase [Thermoanaerobacterium thermosaccharolyticum]MBE0229401.1 histidinol dehydrogenase [Thermoanaerobacterium thermosaccharolyticum]MBP2071774.1 histidinol dehydrogenase [Thermoanaerobacterium butyriciformans]
MIKIYDFSNSIDNTVIKNLTNRSKLENKDVEATVSEIIYNVKMHGDRALFDYTLKYDGVEIDDKNIMVEKKEIDDAYSKVDKEFISALRNALKNITEYHENQKQKTWLDFKGGIVYGQKIRPLEKVGIYVPGGTASYPSSVLMNSIPAKVAGVDEIVMVTPVKAGLNPFVIVAANEVGINKIYKIGGAQAIAALAFGTESIPKVDKIVGPGNIFVAMAKRAVYGYVDIDMVAGPSEVLIVADESGNPTYLAADLLSQAEHDAMASAVLITTSKSIAEKVAEEVSRQTLNLERKDIINKSLEDYGAIIIVNNLEDALNIANQIAPEHLELAVDNPFEMIGMVKNAGAIFLGENSPEPLGDYIAGPNHVLPTSGTSRFFSPLSVDDFIKKMSILYYDENSLKNVSDDIVRLAEAEGLTAHANSIKVRFKR